MEVTAVQAESPLVAGDRLLEFLGGRPRSLNFMAWKLRDTRAGTSIPIRVRRGNSDENLTLIMPHLSTDDHIAFNSIELGTSYPRILPHAQPDG